MIKIFRTSFNQVSQNWRIYFNSLMILQAIRVLLVLPILSFIFYKMLSKAQLVGITNENIGQLVTSPWALGLGLVLMLVFVFFTFYELGYYFVLAQRLRTGQFVKFREIAKQLNRKARFFFSLQSLLLVGYFLLILPIASIGLSPELTQQIKIPDFIIDELIMTPTGQVIYVVLLGFVSYLALRLVYAIYYFVTDSKLSIWDAIKKSWDYSKGRSIQNLVLLGGIGAIYGALLAGSVFLLFMPLIAVEAVIPTIAPLIAGVTLTTVQLLLFFFGGAIQPLIASGLTETVNSKSTQIKVAKAQAETTSKKGEKSSRKTSWLFVVGGVVLLAANTWSAITVVYAPQTKIIAHRGFTEKGVENSLGSLQAAAEAQADYVEMDIQETQDQQFVVMHDYNLKRLAGVNQEVYQLTLKELEALEIKQKGFTDQIPSLEAYIELAQELNIKLLIEVKPHGHESAEFVQNLVTLLKEKKVINRFLVQSLDLTILDELKKIEPSIRTGYIIPLNFGKLPESQHDFYVLEDFSVTESVLKDVEGLNKEMFVWTVNKEELMKKYFRQDVDGLITNHPDKALTLRESREDTKSFFNRVQYLLE